MMFELLDGLSYKSTCVCWTKLRFPIRYVAHCPIGYCYTLLFNVTVAVF